MEQQILDTLILGAESSSNLEKTAFVLGLVICFALGFHKGGQR
jgi:hypothetical protein